MKNHLHHAIGARGSERSIVPPRNLINLGKVTLLQIHHYEDVSVRRRAHDAILRNRNQHELNENCSEVIVVELRLNRTQLTIIGSASEGLPRGLSLSGEKARQVPSAVIINRNFFLEEHSFVAVLARCAKLMFIWFPDKTPTAVRCHIKRRRVLGEMQIGIGHLCRAAGFEPPVICTPEELLGS